MKWGVKDRIDFFGNSIAENLSSPSKPELTKKQKVKLYTSPLHILKTFF